MAQRKSPWVPIVMLSLGLAGGWWLARQGLKLPEKFQTKTATQPAVKAPETTSARAVDDKRDAPVISVPAVTNVRRVDFDNFRYTPECLRNEDGARGSLTTRNGKFERNEEFDKLNFTVNQVIYGDLTGDDELEAVVLSACNTGGSGTLTEGYVYAVQTGRLVEIGRVDSGSKAYGGIVGVEIDKRVLVVERYATDEDGAHCCPKYIDTEQFHWNGTKLVARGETSRRAAPASD